MVLSQLRELIMRPYASGIECDYPRLRNYVLDIMAEGRKKNIINLIMEADITEIQAGRTELRALGSQVISLTAAIAWSFAAAINEDRKIQAYRRGRSRLVIFDDVDLAVMIERDMEGTFLPLSYVVRSANRKSAAQIHKEITAAKIAPVGLYGPLTALEKQFFLFPAFLRRILWFFIRRNPYWFKDIVGTAGLTSVGMLISDAAVLLPVTPMSITLSIGGISKKPKFLCGQFVERDIIHLNLSADHDVIDGAPLTRFAQRLKKKLEEVPNLLQTAG